MISSSGDHKGTGRVGAHQERLEPEGGGMAIAVKLCRPYSRSVCMIRYILDAVAHLYSSPFVVIRQGIAPGSLIPGLPPWNPPTSGAEISPAAARSNLRSDSGVHDRVRVMFRRGSVIPVEERNQQGREGYRSPTRFTGPLPAVQIVCYG